MSLIAISTDDYVERRVITLSPEEMKPCEECGSSRDKQSADEELENQHGFDGDPGKSLINNISSECGAYCAGLVYNLPWESRINTFRNKADLGLRTEVRTLGCLSYDFFVRPKRDPMYHTVDGKTYKAVYILVIGKWPHPVFWVCGYITGLRAKTYPLRPLANNRPWVHRVPQIDLNPPPPYDPCDE